MTAPLDTASTMPVTDAMPADHKTVASRSGNAKCTTTLLRRMGIRMSLTGIPPGPPLAHVTCARQSRQWKTAPRETMTCMSNLGLYQLMTTAAKRVGGPIGLVASILSVGIGVGAGAGFYLGRKTARPKPNGDEPATETTTESVFTVTTDGEDGNLKFRVGDHFRVLERDGDAVLIEVLGDATNPYFVSADLLRAISDYPQPDEPADDERSPS